MVWVPDRVMLALVVARTDALTSRPMDVASTYALVAASWALVGSDRLVIRWEFSDTAAVGAAIWSRRLVRTWVSKSEIVAASWVPVWLARASGLTASLDSWIAALAATLASVIAPAATVGFG
jgi:hypothetical protein